MSPFGPSHPAAPSTGIASQLMINHHGNEPVTLGLGDFGVGLTKAGRPRTCPGRGGWDPATLSVKGTAPAGGGAG